MDQVNEIASNLLQLDETKRELEPSQRELHHCVTRSEHKLVYQTEAAIAESDAKQSAPSLAMKQCPNNIERLSRQSNRIADSVGTFTQYEAPRQN